MTVISLNCWSESDQKAIREQLDRILKSGPFHQSRRRQRFLEYIVNETLAGRGERLKGYNVALAVFDRPETFRPQHRSHRAHGGRATARQASRILREPTAKAIPFASICRRAPTHRKSSFGTMVLRRDALLAGRRSVRGNWLYLWRWRSSLFPARGLPSSG